MAVTARLASHVCRNASRPPRLLLRGGSGQFGGGRRAFAAAAQDAKPLRIVVHGGAWSIPDDLTAVQRRACETAAGAGFAVLERGGTAIDAVEAAVRTLEDDPCLDAGYGSWLNEDGEAELDAMVMEGTQQRCGAVAGVQVKNPVSLARAVMEKTEHVLLIAEGAERFGEQHGFGRPPREQLVTPEAEEELRKFKQYAPAVQGLFAHGHADRGHDTVGAVAMDAEGRLACATSTGGVTAKKKGRVGDSPIPGCGGYADDHVGAASSTGHGEAILRTTLCRHALWLREQGQSGSAAANAALDHMHQRCQEQGGGTGGLIMITADGEVVKAFNTKRMVWASMVQQASSAGSEMEGKLESGIERADVE
eukprot:TRINITY_DN111661_c0_g1_i1.p1 TRINITY_DN111661_c0_g1~~TRINITY_DN111661_c0_g1_i1.p1  ORF type:complete len:382 (-),score=83.40 TRINITY_DN111661_c0_g1_i1:41-1135(-)